MSDAKGPYKAEHWEGKNEFVVTGPGWETMGGTYTKNEAEIAARFANLAWSAGRSSLLPALEKAATSLEEVYDGHLDIMPDGSSLFDWKAWALEAKEALAAIRAAKGKS